MKHRGPKLPVIPGPHRQNQRPGEIQAAALQLCCLSPWGRGPRRRSPGGEDGRTGRVKELKAAEALREAHVWLHSLSGVPILYPRGQEQRPLPRGGRHPGGEEDAALLEDWEKAHRGQVWLDRRLEIFCPVLGVRARHPDIRHQEGRGEKAGRWLNAPAAGGSTARRRKFRNQASGGGS